MMAARWGAAPVDLRLWLEVFFDAVAVVALGLALGEAVGGPSSTASYVVLASAAASFAARRWVPLASVAVSAAASVGAAFVSPNAVWIWVITQLCVVTVGLWRQRRLAFGAGLTVGAALYVSAVWVQGYSPISAFPLLLVAWTAWMTVTGIAIHIHHDYIVSLRERAAALLHDRERDVRERITEERLRIARELHDAVAHNVTVISIHAGSAERQLDNDPTRAHESLADIRAAARSIIVQMGEILRVLRTDDREQPASPMVGNDLRGIVDVHASLGLAVTADLSAVPNELPENTALAAARVLQESLTNAHRHGDGTARVRTHSGVGFLRLEVENPLRRAGMIAPADLEGIAPADSEGSGWGLIGIRERMAFVGGSVRAGVDDGVFKMVAEFPLESNERSVEVPS